MKILWAVKVGDEDWNEQIITENEADIEQASKWALANGFHKLRVAEVDLAQPPDFTSTINV